MPRLRDLKRALEQLGFAVEKPSSGSHWKVQRPGQRVYPLTAHNGLKTDIPWRYVRALCRHFDIDFDELAALVGKPRN